MREAHQESEKNLNKVATTLKLTLDQTTTDIDGLFAKLNRKSAAAEANVQAVLNYGKSLQDGLAGINTGIRDLATKREENSVDLSNILQHFSTTQNQVRPQLKFNIK